MMSHSLDFAVDVEWIEGFCIFFEKLSHAVEVYGAQPSACAAIGLNEPEWGKLQKKPELSSVKQKTSKIAELLIQNLSNDKACGRLKQKGNARGELFFESTEEFDQFWLRDDIKNQRERFAKELQQQVDFQKLKQISPDQNLSRIDSYHDINEIEQMLDLSTDFLHHSVSELGDFLPVGFPRSNRDQEGGSPLLMDFAFYTVPVRIDGPGSEYELRVNSTKLQMRLSTPVRKMEMDRMVEDDNGSTVRIKRVSQSLDGKALRWLIENPADGEQLDGEFKSVPLCIVSNAAEARGVASMTTTAGQIVVMHKGERIGSGRQHKCEAARVVAQWAVWAGLGEPSEEDPVYSFGSHHIADRRDD